MKNRVIAMGVVVGFFALLTTNADPKMWQVALISVCIYEVVLMALNILDSIPKKRERAEKKRKVAQNTKVRKEEGSRLDAIVFNVLRTMREVS